MRFFLSIALAVAGSSTLAACSGTDASIADDDDGGGGSASDGGGAGGGVDATTGDGGSGRDATTSDGAPGGGDASSEDGGMEAGSGAEGGALDAGDAGDAGDAAPSPDDVPITIDYLHDHGNDDIGFGVQVTLGATQVPALLDTGSTGIRVVMGAVSMDDFASIGTTATSVSYGSGTVASGVVATARVTFGNLTTAAAIPVQLITGVGCTDAKPDCPARDGDLDSFAFKGESGGTWKVIVGVGMRTSGDGNAIGNPIVQLPGTPAYLIDVSGGYGSTSGTLRIAPTPAETATFKSTTLPSFSGGGTLGNGVAAYDDRQNPVCIEDSTSMMTYCAPALLDCGNASVVVDWAPARRSIELASGDAVDVQLRTALGMDGLVLSDSRFTVSDDPAPGQDLVELETTGADDSSINSGTLFFFRQKVLEDQTTGAVGVAPF